MMTAQQYRAQAELMERATQDSADGFIIAQCLQLAKEWRWLAALADWQEAMLKRGHPAY